MTVLLVTVSSDEAKSAEVWDATSWGIWQSSRERREKGRHEKLSLQGFGLRGGTYQDCGSHEEVIEGVVQQVDAGGRVQICIAHQLAGKQRLSGAAAQEAAHLAVGHVQSVGQHLPTQTPECKKNRRLDDG